MSLDLSPSATIELYAFFFIHLKPLRHFLIPHDSLSQHIKNGEINITCIFIQQHVYLIYFFSLETTRMKRAKIIFTRHDVEHFWCWHAFLKYINGIEISFFPSWYNNIPEEYMRQIHPNRKKINTTTTHPKKRLGSSTTFFLSFLYCLFYN